jgi:hypothetical protein
MTSRSRWVAITIGAGLAVALATGTAAAADKTKVDRATQRVEQGARQIGQGQVGEGVKETAKGIGNTVVEGAKFSGQTIKEFFAGK